MMDVPRNIKSQLRDCARRPGIWAGCPPDKYSDPELAFMLDNKLVQWVGKGYVLTSRGKLALTPSPASK